MKYEFILKVKYSVSDSFHEKFHCKVGEKQYFAVKTDYENYLARNKNEFFDSIILINRLDDNGEFVETIQ